MQVRMRSLQMNLGFECNQKGNKQLVEQMLKFTRPVIHTHTNTKMDRHARTHTRVHLQFTLKNKDIN